MKLPTNRALPFTILLASMGLVAHAAASPTPDAQAQANAGAARPEAPPITVSNQGADAATSVTTSAGTGMIYEER